MAIDIGIAAESRPTVWGTDYTYVVRDNPANADGTLLRVEIYANTELSNVEVATFYVVSGNNLSTRATASIGTVSAGSKQIFSVSLAVVTGDYIGIYFTAGAIEGEFTGYAGLWRQGGDQIPCTNQAFGTLLGDDSISLYGSDEAPSEWENIAGATTDPYNDTGAPANGDGRYYRCVENATGASQQISSVDRGYRKVAPTPVTDGDLIGIGIIRKS